MGNLTPLLKLEDYRTLSDGYAKNSSIAQGTPTKPPKYELCPLFSKIFMIPSTEVGPKILAASFSTSCLV